MKLAVTTGLILLLGSTCLHAQQALVGTYSGSYIAKTNKGDRPYGVTLQITSAENGALRATANRLAGSCLGQYELEGTYQDDKLQLKSSDKGGRAGDCGFRLQLTVDGNKLAGKMNSLDVQLAK